MYCKALKVPELVFLRQLALAMYTADFTCWSSSGVRIPPLECWQAVRSSEVAGRSLENPEGPCTPVPAAIWNQSPQIRSRLAHVAKASRHPGLKAS